MGIGLSCVVVPAGKASSKFAPWIGFLSGRERGRGLELTASTAVSESDLLFFAALVFVFCVVLRRLGGGRIEKSSSSSELNSIMSLFGMIGC